MLIYAIFLFLISLSASDLGLINHSIKKYENTEINKDTLPSNFFTSLQYHAENVVFIEAGLLHMEQCAWKDAVVENFKMPRYTWVGPDQKTKLTNTHSKVLKNGDLIFVRPSKMDNGVYFCKVSDADYPDEYKEYQRTILVFMAPDWVKEFYFHFLIPDCSESSTNSVITMTENIFCQNDKNCLYKIHKSKCISNAEFLTKKEFHIRVEQFLPIGFKSAELSKCGYKCAKDAAFKELDNQSNKTIKDMRLRMKFKHRENLEILLMEKKMSYEKKPLCISGYKLYKQEICVPCNKGEIRTYSLEDQTCVTCGLLTYSAFYAESNCQYCPLLKVAPTYGTPKKEDCVWFYDSPTALAIFVPGIILFSLIIGCLVSLIPKRGKDQCYELRDYMAEVCCYGKIL